MNISKISKLFKISKRIKLHHCCSVKPSTDGGLCADNTKPTSVEETSEHEEFFGIPLDVYSFHKSASNKIFDTSGVVDKYDEYFSSSRAKKPPMDKVIEFPFGYVRLDAHNDKPVVHNDKPDLHNDKSNSNQNHDSSKSYNTDLMFNKQLNANKEFRKISNSPNTSVKDHKNSIRPLSVPQDNDTFSGKALLSNQLINSSEALKTRMEVNIGGCSTGETNQLLDNDTPISEQPKVNHLDLNVIDNQYFGMPKLETDIGTIEPRTFNYFEASENLANSKTSNTKLEVSTSSFNINKHELNINITPEADGKVAESIASGENVIDNQYFGLSLSEENAVSNSGTGKTNSLHCDFDTSKNIIEGQYFGSQNNLLNRPEDIAAIRSDDENFPSHNMNSKMDQLNHPAYDSDSISLNSNDCAPPIKNDKISFSAIKSENVEEKDIDVEFGNENSLKKKSTIQAINHYQKLNDLSNNEGNFSEPNIISHTGGSPNKKNALSEVPMDPNNIETVQFDSHQRRMKSKKEFPHDQTVHYSDSQELPKPKGIETGLSEANNQHISLKRSTSNEKLDSKGFRIVKSENPNLYNMINSEVLNLLKKSIIYDNHDIVALNKPFGLICQGGKSNSRSKCLNSYLKDLALHVHKNSVSPAALHLTHRLDRDTTGVLLLAKTERLAAKLHEMFADQKIKKTYLALVRGVPSCSEGIIDIPICEGTIGDKYRMVLSPQIEYQPGSVSSFGSSKGHRAVTYYNVLDSNYGTSLLEVKPQNGLKHQIRVHLGFGLGCPIVGDHKYTYLNKIVPQKLPGDTLDALGIRQSKVRDLPLHLHSLQVILPELIEGRNITISAGLPKLFSKTLRALKYRWQY